MRSPWPEVALAWCLLVGSLIGWPVSALTVARGEPQFILGLSWLAIALTALDFVQTSRVHRDQDETEGGPGAGTPGPRKKPAPKA